MGKLAVIESDLSLVKKAEIIKTLQSIYDWYGVIKTGNPHQFKFIYHFSYSWLSDAEVNIFIDEKGFYINVIDSARSSPFDIFHFYQKVRNRLKDTIKMQTIDKK